MFGMLTFLFGGWRTYFVKIAAVGVVVLFFNKFKALVAECLTWLLGKIGTLIDLDSVTLSFSGFAGYMIHILKIDECLTVLLAALMIRFSLSLIPWIK